MTLDNSGIVLVVDDTAASRETMLDALHNQGYELHQASNGHDAIQQAKSIHPDLILLDVMMPGMDGFQVCNALRADIDIAEVPVLMVTALDDKSSRLRGIEAGADDFISKPFDRAELRARARTITRLNRYRKLREEKKHVEQILEELQRKHTDVTVALSQLRETHEATLLGWVNALDLRDKETQGHSARVVYFSTLMADTLGIKGADRDTIRRGALLHDVGKLGIPDAILLKPGLLTVEERLIMNQHAEYGYQWLKDIPYLTQVADVVHSHHEKWDGTGYPQGLRGETIPLGARIFSMVDVYDALTSSRPYRPIAWSKEKTIDYIKSLSGQHFEPSLVDIFVRVLTSKA